ncbi:thiamine diphosphokinase [Paracoccus sp. (in: a-proteobacteria)]|uniref:thiamine diphosphokinase n=1 Tax=Paracoccus sp. TaxID=267 RepID=UPI0026DEB600|nr:thiamine diphosphokinase [Paracoccus sp. (in: a-proteobacteria)]MDO5648531.1 thiamine diphosphokinase [Paracoccus sp. (in: a-proteobacteria)]
MTRPVSADGVTLVGGGELSAADLEQARAIAPLLVAADGGADRARDLGHQPDWIIGDLDSLTGAARASVPPSRLLHVAEQDSTDFVKCLTRIDARFVLAVGFAGGRVDHTLAAMTALVSTDARVLMLTGDDVIFAAPPELRLDVTAGTRVSLFPMGPATGTSTGLEWPIDGLTLTPAGQIGTSNRATGPVSLTMNGPLLVILARDCLGAVMAGLNL